MVGLVLFGLLGVHQVRTHVAETLRTSRYACCRYKNRRAGYITTARIFPPLLFYRVNLRKMAAMKLFALAAVALLAFAACGIDAHA